MAAKKKKTSRFSSYEERQKVCGDKVRYATASEAKAYIVSTQSRIPLSFYRCPVCKGLHVTSN